MAKGKSRAVAERILPIAERVGETGEYTGRGVTVEVIEVVDLDACEPPSA